MLQNTQQLAPYAVHGTRGRLVAEPECAMRSPHQRDRDRVLHSTAFRRLEYKTQVFVNHQGDHYRTRLTHSLEVSQLARSLARCLRLNEDLVETLALAHDLGHTPFGHAGEDGLNEAMETFGGFDHNAQTIRILTHLEQRYAAFDGLNLTWETLEGIAKHNGPVAHMPRALQAYAGKHDLELGTYASLEAQIASLADDIAYHNHDIEDGLRAGFFTIAELAELPLLNAICAEVENALGGLEEERARHEIVRRMINRMVADLLGTTQAAITEAKITHVDQVRKLGRPLAQFSPAMQATNKTIKEFLFARMYRHYKVNRMASKARRIVKELFDFFLAEPECLPTRWRALASESGTQQTAETVADYIAGMTDRFAIEEYEKIFDPNVKN
jgi:dGTPase